MTSYSTPVPPSMNAEEVVAKASIISMLGSLDRDPIMRWMAVTAIGCALEAVQAKRLLETDVRDKIDAEVAKHMRRLREAIEAGAEAVDDPADATVVTRGLAANLGDARDALHRLDAEEDPMAPSKLHDPS